MIEVENGYVSTGFLGDSVNANATPMIFSKFDFHGEKIFQETYGGFNDYQFWSQNPDLQFLNDTTVIHSGITFDNEGIRLGYLMKSNLNGDTLETLRFYSPNYPEDLDHSSLFPIRLEQSTDDNFLVLSGINNEGTGNDRMIQKLTPEGELLWTYEYATEQNDFIHTIIPTSDGGGISESYRIIELGVSGQNHFFKYDGHGELDWEFFTSPENSFGNIVDGILDDQFIVCTTAERRFGASDDWTPLLLKIDTLGNVVWKTKIWENDFSREHRHRQIVKAQDDNYVSGGVHGIDTSGFLSSSSAFLAKVNTEGELMWQRKYKYFDLGNDRHVLRDLKATSDGGFIFCGEANATDEDNPEVTGPYQQGWLVKVDEHGCLVEDCHLSDNVSEIDVENKEYFKASPIPASDFLNIYQIQSLPPSAVYELYDLQGRLVKTIPAVEKNTTLMLDISDLNSGNYVLSLGQDNQLLQNKKVTIN